MGLNQQGVADKELDFFVQMQTKKSLELTHKYHLEETKHVSQLLNKQSNKINNAIVVGCGNLRYRDLAIENSILYIGIDLYLKNQLTVDRSDYDLVLLNKCFSEVASEDLTTGPSAWIFPFNVYPYLPKARSTILRLTSPSDVLMFSTWNVANPEATKVRDNYYSTLPDAINSQLYGEASQGLFAELQETLLTDSHYCIRKEQEFITTYTFRPGLEEFDALPFT